MESSTGRFFAVCLTTVSVLSGHAIGSEDDQGNLLTPPADHEPLPYDTGRLLLGFFIAIFVVWHLATISYKIRAGHSISSDVGADQDDIDSLDLIVLMSFQCVHMIASSPCTAMAACWRGATHIFFTAIRGFTGPPSASLPPAHYPLASLPTSSFLAATPEPALSDPLVARGSSCSFITSSTSGACGALARVNSCLTQDNSLLNHRLQEMTSDKRQLQLQLHDTRAALITSCSTANSAGTLAAQAVAGKQRYKAALREMRACVEEMYTEGELAFECILKKKDKLTEEWRQERASRRQEVQTLMDQVYSLTAQLTLSQRQASAEQQNSNKLAKHNTQLKQERDTANRTGKALYVTLRRMIENQMPAEREEEWRKTSAFLTRLASKMASVGPGTHPTAARPCSSSSPSTPATSLVPSPRSPRSRTRATALPSKRQDGVSCGIIVGSPLKAADVTNREAFRDSSNQQLAVQAAATHSMSACRPIPSSVAPRKREACSRATTLDAKENVQPASFTFSSTRCPCLDTEKFIFLPHINSPAEAVPSLVNRRSLSPTIATEAYSHVTVRYTGGGNLGHAQLSRSAPTAPGANIIHVEHSMQAPVTAAKAVSSAASNILLPPAAGEADKISESSCTSSAANSKHDITTNVSATIGGCGNCHALTSKNTQTKGSIAATRLDEASLSLMTLAGHQRGPQHSSEQEQVH